MHLELKHVTGARRAELEALVEKHGADRPVTFGQLVKSVDSITGGIKTVADRSKERDDTIIALVEQLERRCATLEARIVHLEGQR